jgi:four helix bundle protein
VRKGEILSNRLKVFAVSVSSYCNSIEVDSLGKVMSMQLVRASTSVSLNHSEARVASSPRDFIHKLRIAQKEIHEVCTGLEILQLSSRYPDPETLDRLIKEAKELASMIYASIRTAKNNMNNNTQA